MLKVKDIRKQAWIAITLLLLSMPVLFFLIPPEKPLFAPDYSTMITDEAGELLQVYLNGQEQWHFPARQDSIPEKLKLAVLSYEDEAFYRHIGVDFTAVFRAAYHNFKTGKITSGASTLTMQVARMRRPKARSYLNKFLEMLDALKIECYYSKEEILQLYLDHAPYGGNVIGYQTASLKFFGKSPAQLSWSEAATLAVLPNAPGLIYPSKTNQSLRHKRDALLTKLWQKGLIDAQTYELAGIEPVPDRFIAFSAEAPHLSRRLKSKYPQQKIIATTINRKIQQSSNQIAQKYQHILAPYGIHNLSILIADTKTGEIKAYVGSPDFFDAQHGGQVDGVQAARSSGSVLKPLLYALAMDEGLILPQSLIRDLPTYFEGFAPANANEKFQGLATAHEALVNSLNIPAVRLLNSYGVFQFYAVLKEAGLSTLFRTADDYGLPLILGGAEVSLWDMLGIYRGLANEGMFQASKVLQDERLAEAKPLLSPGAAYLTLQMMNELIRPGIETHWQKFAGRQTLAWKTGTSFGHKDAWAIGVNPQYTIGVWVGNFNGESNKNLSGVSSAGPVLFDLLQALPQTPEEKDFAKSDIHFEQKPICSLSGFAALKACPQVDTVAAPYYMKPLKTCEYHSFKHFSSNGRYQTCSHCWGSLGGIRKSVTTYAPDIAYYLRENGRYIEKIPGHYPHCKKYRAEQSIQIIYPNLDARLFLPRDYNGAIQQVVCKVGNTQTIGKVYWYLDEAFLGSTEGEHKLAVQFKPGKNHLKVIDENGSEDSRHVFAQFSTGNSK